MGYSLERELQTGLVKIKIINQIIEVFAFNSEYVFLKHQILLPPADALDCFGLVEIRIKGWVSHVLHKAGLL